MPPSGDIFAAVGDPTRRRIFERLTAGGPSTATALAAEFEITRQAVAKHLAILAAAGMAKATKVGRETRFEADATALAELREWVTQVEGEWADRLDALAKSLSKKK